MAGGISSIVHESILLLSRFARNLAPFFGFHARKHGDQNIFLLAHSARAEFMRRCEHLLDLMDWRTTPPSGGCMQMWPVGAVLATIVFA